MTSKNTDTSGMTDTHTRERESKGEKEFEEALRQEKGEGVEQDMRKAAQHLEKAVELNHTGAMVKLAKAYKCGLGVECDKSKAMDLLTRAAKQGNAQAMLMVGVMMIGGESDKG